MEFRTETSKMKKLTREAKNLVNQYIGLMMGKAGIDGLEGLENHTEELSLLTKSIELMKQVDELAIEYDERFTKMENNQKEIMKMLEKQNLKLENIENRQKITDTVNQ